VCSFGIHCYALRLIAAADVPATVTADRPCLTLSGKAAGRRDPLALPFVQ